MANQDPQPEIYTTSHNFDASAANVTAGTTNTVTVYTNQANNEEVRIYAIEVMVQDENGSPVTTLTGTVDQAALQGLLRRLYSLGLPLISVFCLEYDLEELIYTRTN